MDSKTKTLILVELNLVKRGTETKGWLENRIHYWKNKGKLSDDEAVKLLELI